MFGASGPAPTLAFAPSAIVAPVEPVAPPVPEANESEKNLLIQPNVAEKIKSTSDLAIDQVIEGYFEEAQSSQASMSYDMAADYIYNLFGRVRD